MGEPSSFVRLGLQTAGSVCESRGLWVRVSVPAFLFWVEEWGIEGIDG